MLMKILNVKSSKILRALEIQVHVRHVRCIDFLGEPKAWNAYRASIVAASWIECVVDSIVSSAVCSNRITVLCHCYILAGAIPLS